MSIAAHLQHHNGQPSNGAVRNETEAAIAATESLLERASEIDPEAWQYPTPPRMKARRSRSYAQAVAEFRAFVVGGAQS